MAKKAKKPKKGSWIVRMKCVVYKDVFVGDCTEDQAREDPWEHATEENEVETVDWDVMDVRHND